MCWYNFSVGIKQVYRVAWNMKEKERDERKEKKNRISGRSRDQTASQPAS